MTSEIRIGELAASSKGSFKIGPFGSSLKKEDLSNEGIPVAGIENILANQFIPRFRRFISEQKFAQLSDYKIEPDDILISTMGTIGRAAIAYPTTTRSETSPTVNRGSSCQPFPVTSNNLLKTV